MKGKSTLHHNTLSHKRGTDTQGNAMAQTKKRTNNTPHIKQLITNQFTQITQPCALTKLQTKTPGRQNIFKNHH